MAASGASDQDRARSQPRIAIVHDYVTQRGGAERVALALLRTFPGSRLVTSFYEPDTTFDEFRDVEIETLRVNRIGALRKDPRRAVPILAPAFSQHVVQDADLLICSSSGWAHGIGGNQPRVVYCYNPARWLYQWEEYRKGAGGLAKLVMPPLTPSLRGWDARAAKKANAYVGTSRVVIDRIYGAYGRSAELVPPPVTLDPTGPQQPMEHVESGFLLVVGRGRGYKNVDVIVDAVERLLPDERLVVVGGAQHSETHTDRITYVGTVSDAELRWLYSQCRALVTVAHEDFGLTPLEANLFGRPAVVVRAGGFLDTVIEGVNGTFCSEATPESFAEAVREMPQFDPRAVKNHVNSFSTIDFSSKIQEIVKGVWSKHQNRASG